MTRSKLDVHAIREEAFDKLAHWMHMWDQDSGTDSTESGIREDLRTYSPTEFEGHREGHDHDLCILFPSVGDEAGYWTLYVTTNNNPYRGQKYGHEDHITAMWQVFDTMPNPIYLRDSDDKDVWMFTPEERGGSK